MDYPPARVVALLEQVGCTVARGADRLAEDPGEVGVAAGGGETLSVTPPTWRPDLTDPADLVEEVVRLDGYDHVPSLLPTAPPGRGLTWQQRRNRAVSRSLAERGYVEVLAHPFVSAELADQLGLPADDPRRQAVRLANPLSEEEPLLRTTLLGPLLGIVQRNLGRGQRDLALYEIGAVFQPRPGAGRPPAMGVDRRPTDAEFAAADAVVPAPAPARRRRADRRARAGRLVGRRPAGRLGGRRRGGPGGPRRRRGAAGAGAGAGRRVRPLAPGALCRTAGRRDGGRPRRRTAPGGAGGAGAAQADQRHGAGPGRAAGAPGGARAGGLRLPAGADRRGAGGGRRRCPPQSVQQALTEGAGELLESVRLFDVYASAQLGAGRKSLAYKLTFRAPDRTLTGEEAVAARDAAVARAAERFGATLRGG